MFKKKYIWILAACIALISVNAVQAASTEPETGRTRVSLGIFHLMDSDADKLLGTGGGINLETKLNDSPNYDLTASVGYYKFFKSISGVNVNASLVPVMFTLLSNPASNSGSGGFYGGVGAGVMFSNASASYGSLTDSTSVTDFAYQFVAGVKLGDTVFLEGKYLNASKKGNTGLLFNVGARF